MQSQLNRLNRLLMQRNMLLAALLAVIVCSVAFHYLKTQLGTLMLDEIEGYDRETLVSQLLLYGEAGRVLHAKVTLYVDMVFPLPMALYLAAYWLWPDGGRGFVWRRCLSCRSCFLIGRKTCSS